MLFCYLHSFVFWRRDSAERDADGLDFLFLSLHCSESVDITRLRSGAVRLRCELGVLRLLLSQRRNCSVRICRRIYWLINLFEPGQKWRLIPLLLPRSAPTVSPGRRPSLPTPRRCRSLPLDKSVEAFGAVSWRVCRSVADNRGRTAPAKEVRALDNLILLFAFWLDLLSIRACLVTDCCDKEMVLLLAREMLLHC